MASSPIHETYMKLSSEGNLLGAVHVKRFLVKELSHLELALDADGGVPGFAEGKQLGEIGEAEL
jgi:hypothetical protein